MASWNDGSEQSLRCQTIAGTPARNPARTSRRPVPESSPGGSLSTRQTAYRSSFSSRSRWKKYVSSCSGRLQCG
ncbi:hypothetical protein StrepF001_13435 [Streptomyces sp. F001]|uniref:hypothetical protein n=1 Tax=Streptomyces sp. F001 TaxID=1510026 RepID=UPI00101E6F2D|nr:hypothetical protein [Streptomyces sp. F001]RZB18149.1 hypothetical protein StrepF001_13435 [Streptomyces sp. F001]